MTEQTESMTRLLKDGEIVGYEVKAYNDDYGKVETRRSKDLLNWGECYLSDETGFESDFKHDSFNPSFKYGDQWIFAGDKVQIILKDGDIYTGTVEFDETYFRLIKKIAIPDYNDIDTLIVIGNIYEAQNDR